MVIIFFKHSYQTAISFIGEKNKKKRNKERHRKVSKLFNERSEMIMINILSFMNDVNKKPHRQIIYLQTQLTHIRTIKQHFYF